MRKGVIFIVLCCGYLAFSLGLTVVSVKIALSCLIQQRLVCTSRAAAVAEGAFFPYSLFNTLLQLQLLTDVSSSLNLLKEAPSLFQSVQVLLNSYTQQIPLADYQDVHRVSEQIQRLSPEFERLLTTSPFLDQFCDQCRLLKEKWLTLNPLFRLFILLLDDASNTLIQHEPFVVLVLFQNNMELRPTGGFTGSYGLLTIEEGKPVQFQLEDIYVPDGQLVDHVEPPLPIQEAFQQGFWKLRDANWHPDFRQSAENVEWFFQNSTGQEFNAIVAVPFSSFQKALSIIGPIYLPDAQQQFTAEDVYPLLQRLDEPQFFPGSTKKKDTLQSFYHQLSNQLQALSLTKVLDLLSLVRTELSSKNVLIQADSLPARELLTTLNWDGQLAWLPCGKEDCYGDYLSIYDANLGVNKANCCVDRQVEVEVMRDGADRIDKNITLAYFDHQAEPKYASVSGAYKSYVRVYLAPDTVLEELLINGQAYTSFIQSMKQQQLLSGITAESFALDTVNGLKEIGFWVYVPVETASIVEIKTHRPLDKTSTLYQLDLQKQPGVLDQYNHFTVNLFGEKSFNNLLDKDTTLLHRISE